MNANKDFIKSAITFGLMMAGAFMLIDLLFYVFDATGMGMAFGLFLFIIILALYFVFFIWGGRSYRTKYTEGYMKYWQAFVYCLIMALVFTLAMFIYNFIFYTFFDPQRAANEMQKAAEMIQDNSYIPDDQKEIQIKRILENSSAIKMVIRNLISNAITAIVIAAISALFVRKKEKISEVF
jgi:hypothetical protein